MEKFRAPKLEGPTNIDPIQYMAGCTWDEIECNNIQKFQYGDYPELIYVIKTGFKNEYLVVHEDAYHLNIGDTSLMTKEKVEKTYSIKLKI